MIRGIVPAIIMPMDSKFALDLDEYEKYLRWLKSFGITGVAVNVDTGEGPVLTKAERSAAVASAKKIMGQDKTLVAGIIGNSTSSAVDCAKDARNAGADLGLVFPNSFFMGQPLDSYGPVLYHNTIASESMLELIAFQLQSSLGGIEYPIDVLLDIAKSKSTIGVKEATFDCSKFLNTLRRFKKDVPYASFLTGNDNFIFESFVLGADGALIGYGTLPVQDLVEMFELVKSGKVKEAEELNPRVQQLADVVFGPPVRNYRARTKYALAKMGIIREERTFVRPPLLPVASNEKEEINSALKAAALV